MSGMRKTLAPVLYVLVAATLACLSRCAHAQDDQIVFAGVVSDREGNPIEGVKVLLWRSGVPSFATTDAEGEFEIALSVGPPIDSLVLRHADFHDGAIFSGFSGTANSAVSKILWSRNEPIDDAGIALGQIAAYQHILGTLALSEPETVPELLIMRTQILDSLRMLEDSLTDGEIFDERVRGLLRSQLEYIYQFPMD